MGLDLLTQPPRDQPEHVRQPASQRQSDERIRVGLGDRDQARPDQCREIVVGVVFGPRDKGCGQLLALGHRQPLQRRGKHQAHQGRGIIPGERGEFVPQVSTAARRPARPVWL